MVRWETLGAVDPERLVDARLQLHWAAQAAAAPGKLLLPPQPDYGQQSFRWDERARALAQAEIAEIAGARPLRSALRLSPPALLLLDAEGTALAELPLDGRTLEEAYAWLEERLTSLLGHPLPGPLERPGELPAHPVGTGRAFAAGDLDAFAELARYFAAADRAIAAVQAGNPGASPVRCWPHHFDLATLIQLDGPAAGESGRSIGVGFSPGDGERHEPYLYVTPWPYPSDPADPALPSLEGGGSWHRQGWLGAVLAASRIVGAGSNGAQRRQVESFLDSAVAACRALLAAGG